MRISPIDEVHASIGLHEEFAFEAVIDEIVSRGLIGKKLMLVVNTLGGAMHSSFKVARALRQSFKQIEVFVPHIAASGGTLIALTGDVIVMGIMSQLSPLDPQIRYKGRQISALHARHAYNRLCNTFAKKTKEEAPYPQQALADKLDPFLMEDWHAAVSMAEDCVAKILQMSRYGEDAQRIAIALVREFPDHDNDIDYEAAKNLGLRVARYDESERNRRVWRHFRAWLGGSLFQESATHIVRYVLPRKD